jgi:hypothetical protein
MGKDVIAQVELLAGGSRGNGKNCREGLTILTKQSGSAELADPMIGGLAAFRVEDGNGFALFYGARQQKFMVAMVRKGGDWKVRQLAPVAYPIGSTGR